MSNLLNVFKRNIVVFTDGGLDDLVAIRELINSTKHIDRVIHLIPCDGNVPHNVVIENLCKTVNNTTDGVIIYRLTDKDIIDDSIEICSEWVGEDGLGNLSNELTQSYPYSDTKEISTDDLSAMISKSKLVDIIILSPMSVPYKVLYKVGIYDIASKEEKIGVYVMGGCEEKGNFSEDMEFNQGIEPVSFKKCMLSLNYVYQLGYINLNVMTLERCMTSVCNMNNYSKDFNGDKLQMKFLDANYSLMCARNNSLVDGEEAEDLFIFDLYIVQKYLWDLGVIQPVSFEKVTSQIKGVILSADYIINVWDGCITTNVK